ncbi:CgeB family protein [Pontibacter lucknowensis]|uniref:Spore maturation protein CgeB n=1 Tax=Pontibacter lucknowensis TaxID=1077936 RepID=A0A1N6Y996_9BACT|nr:glycosyltransferase [Pontibacter lucknowensis]SIR11202.1 Spore maturation protein CgeB [Pontibacter lucknowensis]
MNIVILGLSITTSWGNGHATTYRNLVRALNANAHHVLFLERKLPQRQAAADLGAPDFCQLGTYATLEQLKQYTEQVREADLVIMGSSLSEGIVIGKWIIETAKGIKAFYDLDAPATLTELEGQGPSYLSASLIPAFDLYLSCTGGPALELFEQKYGANMARPLYFSVNPELYHHEYREIKWDLGYLGAYSEDRQSVLQKLMVDAAAQWPEGRFAVAGTKYPEDMGWPGNINMLHHLTPVEHRDFFNSQRFALSLARSGASRFGYTPSMRLFEAAACCTPVISDYWEGIESLFEPESEILITKSASETLRFLREICTSERKAIGTRARRKVMAHHTAAHRAHELETYVGELMSLNTSNEPKLETIG